MWPLPCRLGPLRAPPETTNAARLGSCAAFVLGALPCFADGMTKRLRSYRQGDIAEGFGLQALRTIGLVAPVPRSEDVGVDAVLTLLERDGGLLHARESCLIQIKSRSSGGPKFEGERLAWLRSLRLPLFYVLVDLKKLRIAIYALHRIEHLLATEDDVDSVVCTLTTRSHKENRHWIGPPVDEFELTDLADPTTVQRTGQLMKAHLDLALVNIALRKYGITCPVIWKQGATPESARLFTNKARTEADWRAVYEVIESLGAGIVKEETEAEEPSQVAEALQIIEGWIREQAPHLKSSILWNVLGMTEG